MSSFVSDKSSHNKEVPPVTASSGEGSAKRNIVRKKNTGGGSGGKKENKIDDGSMYSDPSALDENDPNYDSEEETGKEYIPRKEVVLDYDPELRSALKLAKMTLSEYKKKVEAAIEEYFRSGDMAEIQRTIVEVDCPEYSYELVKRAVSMSLDRSDREREQISQLLSESYPDILSTNMIGKGFERLFELADEFQKDVPLCREHITKFLARCVVDEVLPPSYLSDVVVRNLGGDIVDHAMRMLSREHGSAMLEHSWGPGDGRPVAELKVAVDMLLQEFILSNDAEEACRCIRELNSTYFLHEVVKRGVSASLDSNEEKQLLMSDLFVKLVRESIMSKEQCGIGFTRLLETASDLALDIPAAPVLIHQFIDRASAANILPPDTHFHNQQII